VPLQEFARIAESQLELASVEQASSECQPNSGKLLLRARFFGKRTLADIHLEVPTYQAGRSILRFGSSKSGWTTHTHTSRMG